MRQNKLTNNESFNHSLGMEIAIYWAKQGLKVAYTVEPVGEAGTGGVYQVRSNMVNGLPVAELKHDGRVR